MIFFKCNNVEIKEVFNKTNADYEIIIKSSIKYKEIRQK